MTYPRRATREISLIICSAFSSVKAVPPRLHGVLCRLPRLANGGAVLRRCGNMSSATILFVLEEILRRPSGKMRERVCAVAFGPGLTVEMATVDAIFAPDAAGSPSCPRVSGLRIRKLKEGGGGEGD
jgi:hypothetical protein